MKFLSPILLALLVLTLFSACGDDQPESQTPAIVLRSQSIAEGAEVDAQTTIVLTLEYNIPVRGTGRGVTLNGIAIDASSHPSTPTVIEIPLTLTAGRSYTLSIEAGGIVSTADPKVTAPAFTLNFTTKQGDEPVSDNDADYIARKLGWGWNLGNHFDTSSDTDDNPAQWSYWDNATPTPALYTNLRKVGVSTVRMCTTWGNHQTAGTWTIRPEFLAEVRQNVEWADAAGLNVILNLHHDEYWLDIKGAANNTTTNNNIKQRIQATWKQIAEAFNDKGDFLFFEAFNEIQDGGWGWGANLSDGGKQYRTLNQWNQLVVNTIRATGGNNATRWIGIPGYASNPVYVIDDNFQLPTDPANHLMVSVHFYDPNTFTLTPENGDGKSEWGHTAAAGKFQTGSNEAHVVETFRKLQEKYISRNIPVYIGEYGCVMHSTTRSNRFRNYYLEYVCRAAHTYGMPLIIWDNNATGSGNEHHGYFNHTDGASLNGTASLVQTMIRAATSDDPDYTLQSVYDNAPQ